MGLQKNRTVLQKSMEGRQDLLLCLATLTMIGYATFWRYDNEIFDGKEVWWMISVIAGLVVALIIGIVGYRIFLDVHRRCILCFLWCIFPEKTDDRKRIRGNTEKSVSE